MCARKASAHRQAHCGCRAGAFFWISELRAESSAFTSTRHGTTRRCERLNRTHDRSMYRSSSVGRTRDASRVRISSVLSFGAALRSSDRRARRVALDTRTSSSRFLAYFLVAVRAFPRAPNEQKLMASASPRTLSHTLTASAHSLTRTFSYLHRSRVRSRTGSTCTSKSSRGQSSQSEAAGGGRGAVRRGRLSCA